MDERDKKIAALEKENAELKAIVYQSSLEYSNRNQPGKTHRSPDFTSTIEQYLAGAAFSTPEIQH
jgi:hypothetical protein